MRPLAGKAFPKAQSSFTSFVTNLVRDSTTSSMDHQLLGLQTTDDSVVCTAKWTGNNPLADSNRGYPRFPSAGKRTYGLHKRKIFTFVHKERSGYKPSNVTKN